MPRTERKIAGLERYDAIAAEALVAYGIDSMYATSMCRAASQIAWKRRIWVVRSELRAASAAAVEACARESFACVSTSPCGISATCRFAKGDLVHLDLPELPGKLPRPQDRAGHATYDPEQGVRALLALREGSRRPA